MNHRTGILEASYKPELSIVVYKSVEEHNSNRYYLEGHSFNDQGQILEGKPLLQETIAEMVEMFYGEHKERSQISGFVPENVLFYTPVSGGNYKLVWYRPAETRYIHFAKQLHLQSGKVWVPPMVYIADGSDLTIYALKSDKRPQENAKLYRGPFHNVNDDGEVCLGNAKVKKPLEKTFSSVIKYWEDLFWLSEFSHVNGDDKPVKTDIDKVWSRLVKSKCRLKWDKLDELKDTKKQLKNIL